MSEFHLTWSVIAVYTLLCVAGTSSSTSSNGRCSADVVVKEKCQGSMDARRYFFYNQDECLCEQSTQCLQGSNSFKTENECNNACLKGETVGDWSECSETDCGTCIQSRTRTCNGDDIVETRTEALSPCERKFASFSARLTNTMANTLPGTIIEFNEVFNNHGGAYDSGTGKFTAPCDGIYIFHFYIACLFNGQFNIAHVALYLDGTLQIAAEADSTNGDKFEQGANTVILHLNEGQTVYIMTYTTPNKHDIRAWKTSFTGFLYYED